MLDFLHVDYSTNEVLNALNEDFTKFKRPKPAEEFDPYTPEQRQRVRSALLGFKSWLKSKGKESMSQRIAQYLQQS